MGLLDPGKENRCLVADKGRAALALMKNFEVDELE